MHALLSLDRFSVAPLAARRFELLGVYVALILLPAGVGMVLPFVIDHKKHAKWMQGAHFQKCSLLSALCSLLSIDAQYRHPFLKYFLDHKKASQGDA